MFPPHPEASGGTDGGPDPRSTGFVPNPKLKLREQVHEAMRFFHYSRRTEQAYWGWIVRFLKFHREKNGTKATDGTDREKGWRHPREMGAAEAAEFLSHLANERDVSGSTQNQALNGLVFLYRVVLRQPLGDLGQWARAQRPARLPAVLSRQEMGRMLAAVSPEYQLAVRLIYGSGLRSSIREFDFGDFSHSSADRMSAAHFLLEIA